jgi:hypothetical protein
VEGEESLMLGYICTVTRQFDASITLLIYLLSMKSYESKRLGFACFCVFAILLCELDTIILYQYNSEREIILLSCYFVLRL